MNCPLILALLKPAALMAAIDKEIYFGDDVAYCLEAGCAWYDTEEERCAVLGLSLDMINIREYLEVISDSLDRYKSR